MPSAWRGSDTRLPGVSHSSDSSTEYKINIYDKPLVSQMYGRLECLVIIFGLIVISIHNLFLTSLWMKGEGFEHCPKDPTEALTKRLVRVYKCEVTDLLLCSSLFRNKLSSFPTPI